MEFVTELGVVIISIDSGKLIKMWLFIIYNNNKINMYANKTVFYYKHKTNLKTKPSSKNFLLITTNTFINCETCHNYM